jgi:H+-transporting ATPase
LTFSDPFEFFFQRVFHVESLQETAQDDVQKLASAMYLQVSIISQALIFVTRSRSWSFVERPGLLLVFAFLAAQLVSDLSSVLHRWASGTFILCVLAGLMPCLLTLLADCYFNCCICELGVCWDQGHWMGLGWCHMALQHCVLLATRHHQVLHPLHAERESMGARLREQGNKYTFSGILLPLLLYSINLNLFDAWPNKQIQVAFSKKKDFGKVEREIQWAQEQRTRHGLEPLADAETGNSTTLDGLNHLAEQARWRAEMARYREQNTLKGKLEVVAKEKGLDIHTSCRGYTVS